MTKKEAFIKIMNFLFEKDDLHLDEAFEEEFPLAKEFFNEFKEGKIKNSGGITENGKQILSWMQQNEQSVSNIFTSKIIAEALFTSGRVVSGSMRKLVEDGFLEKVGKDPVRYGLTEQGRNLIIT